MKISAIVGLERYRMLFVLVRPSGSAHQAIIGQLHSIRAELRPDERRSFEPIAGSKQIDVC
jgi:hypothetical protein